MNAPHPLQSQLMPPPSVARDEERGINLVEYWDIVVDNRWLVAAIVALAVGLGGAYAFLARPIYEANLLVQVEDNTGNAKGVLGEAAGLVDVKTATSAELEILRSRLVIGEAVDNARLYIRAHPRYIPVVGDALARHADGLSTPGFLGMPGYVSGTESITVPSFQVPRQLEGSEFRVTALGNGEYQLSNPRLSQPLRGRVGTPLVSDSHLGRIELTITNLQGNPGAEFTLLRRSRLSAVEELQRNLKLNEKGRQSGILDVSLTSSDPDQLIVVLNEIGRQYVRQNVDRKAAEAEKTLAFLDVQMPQFKKQLTHAEELYTRYRNQQGSVALDEEAKMALTRTADLEGKMFEAQQKRRELITRFTADHPAVKTLDSQINAWQQELSRANASIRKMPAVQQDALRLERDVRVSNDLYQQLRNTTLQLQLVREGKIGNVRVIDQATRPELPVGPNRPAILGVAALVGLVGGALLALARNAFFRGIRSAQEIEAETSLNVYSTIPLSGTQAELARKTTEKQPGVHVLAATLPDDAAIESLRSLRTALQFAMLESGSNRILITGATPSVGKSFISSNFAAVLAASGKHVLLIDADLRKGHLNQYFGLARQRGLSELIAGVLQPQDVIRRDVLPNLDLLTTGVLPPNPAELMMSGALVNLLQQLSAEYDYVIVDTPPVLVAADTPAIATQAGALLLVARAGETQMGEIVECAKRLSHAGKSVTGVLLNALDLSRRHYGSYAYKYGGYRYRAYTYSPGK
ncbi:polysaccharide biosynthesis tyrosine autokinase [Ramlibacter alkalitolerans]|uniref:Polysaccharide biosynthesis tyrosine autokinase n=1 Tax=Ramlibacter alkalitolerans TaxID=2039631 RepID=A0ABS1JWV8_9BURK|nr:polysaccharide biosynthesis tyrosine autokinase [Ramlibacter alkalitolerans]MBL0428699.1 polysaccharide biosynthesis tyrosine autokinase [Ramlibacter alkalitolerans]